MQITDVQHGESIYATIDGVEVEFLEPNDNGEDLACDCCLSTDRIVYTSYKPMGYTICRNCLALRD